MATHSSVLAGRIPGTAEPGGLPSMGSHRVRHDWVTFLSLSCIGEGNGNPLQCSCRENPRDGGAWWAAVYGVPQSWTRLRWLSSRSSSSRCNRKRKIRIRSEQVVVGGGGRWAGCNVKWGGQDRPHEMEARWESYPYINVGEGHQLLSTLGLCSNNFPNRKQNSKTSITVTILVKALPQTYLDSNISTDEYIPPYLFHFIF